MGKQIKSPPHELDERGGGGRDHSQFTEDHMRIENISTYGKRRKFGPLSTSQWKPLNVTIRQKAQIMTDSI